MIANIPLNQANKLAKRVLHRNRKPIRNSDFRQTFEKARPYGLAMVAGAGIHHDIDDDEENAAL